MLSVAPTQSRAKHRDCKTFLVMILRIQVTRWQTAIPSNRKLIYPNATTVNSLIINSDFFFS